MKLTCPHCRKILTVADDHAGKRGRCPACGQAVAVPVPTTTLPDKEEPMRDDLPHPDAVNQESAIAPPAAAKPVSRLSLPPARLAAVALVLTAVVAGVLYLAGVWGTAKLPPISLYNTAAEIYQKRHNAIGPETTAAWQKALAEATGEYVTDRQVSFALPNIEGLWKTDGSLNTTVAGDYLARLTALPSQVLIDWRDPLRQASKGAVSNRLAETALRLVEIDRLFNGKQLATGPSQQLLARLKSVSPEQVAQWAEALGVERGQAALVLICMDALFKEDRLDEKQFAKQVARRR